MTCKDCLYYDKLCFYALLPSELNLCKDFMNKADVVSVVRCKDCKYFKAHALACTYPNHNGYCNVNDYCSFGERKCDNG